VAHLRGAGARGEDGLLLREAEQVQLAALVPGADVVAHPVRQLRLRGVQRALQNGVDGQRGHRGAELADHRLGGHEGAWVVVLPLASRQRDRLQQRARGLVAGRLGRRPGARGELLAQRGARQNTLERAWLLEELREREAVQRERRRAARVGHAQELEQILAQPPQRDGARGPALRVF
jgi:hypothetical protein